MTRRSSLATAALCALALAACSREAGEENLAAANAVAADEGMANESMAGVPHRFALTGGDGRSLGSVTLAEDPAGLTINLSVTGVAAGTHGLHLHEKGLCEGPKFDSAGKHMNPGAKQHGRDNPAGAHLGDLDNLVVGADGRATLSLPIDGVMMASGPAMLADADGTSLVIHAKPDDYKTDPSGNSGDRIACAVVAGL